VAGFGFAARLVALPTVGAHAVEKLKKLIVEGLAIEYA
jgi:hypothetical protein